MFVWENEKHSVKIGKLIYEYIVVVAASNDFYSLVDMIALYSLTPALMVVNVVILKL